MVQRESVRATPQRRRDDTIPHAPEDAPTKGRPRARSRSPCAERGELHTRLPLFICFFSPKHKTTATCLSSSFIPEWSRSVNFSVNIVSFTFYQGDEPMAKRDKAA